MDSEQVPARQTCSSCWWVNCRPRPRGRLPRCLPWSPPRTRGRPPCAWRSGSRRWCRRTWPRSCTRPPARTTSPRKTRRKCTRTCSSVLHWGCKCGSFHSNNSPSRIAIKSLLFRGHITMFESGYIYLYFSGDCRDSGFAFCVCVWSIKGPLSAM